MFDWFWEFLYMLSKTIFRLIDGLILCANKLCGIDTINFEGEETDLLSYLLFSDEVGFAFRVSALLATILLVVFTVFMILRTISKDKVEGTPAQLAIRAFKTLLMFFLVPAVMIAFMTLGNAFIKALYAATVQNSAAPGTFLFGAFAQDGGMPSSEVAHFLDGTLDYNNTSAVSDRMILSNFPFLFSWIAGGVVLFGIGSAMLVFVDRILSLVILYIAAPISISTSILDEGARFKLWRDQFLSKFIMGYGMILAINIYAMVCGLVMRQDFTFFAGDGSKSAFLDLIMKLLIIGGGALTMQKSMAVIGNLVSSGAGSSELRDSMSAGALARATMGLGSKALGVAGKALYVPSLPFRAAKSILGDAISQQSRHLGARLLRGVGLKGGYGKKTDKDGNPEPGSRDDDSESRNSEKADYGQKDTAKNAIKNDDGFKTSFGNGNNQSAQKKKDTLSNTINGGGKEKSSGQNKSGQTPPSQQEGGDKK